MKSNTSNPQKRARATGKSGKQHSFVQVPHALLRHANYARLSTKAVKLLFDLFSQFRGRNNGDFTAAWRIMKPKGWKSKDTLYEAIKELLEADFIVKTRQGGKHCCSLYAVTWLAIDECGGKLDIPATRVPAGTWKAETAPTKKTVARIATSVACISG